MRDRVGAALAALDETTRTAVVMRYYDGSSSKEIGEALGISVEAVTSLIHRARHAFRTAYAQQQMGED